MLAELLDEGSLIMPNAVGPDRRRRRYGQPAIGVKRRSTVFCQFGGYDGGPDILDLIESLYEARQRDTLSVTGCEQSRHGLKSLGFRCR